MADLTEFRAGKQRTGSPTAETGCRFDVAGGVIGTRKRRYGNAGLGSQVSVSVGCLTALQDRGSVHGVCTDFSIYR